MLNKKLKKISQHVLAAGVAIIIPDARAYHISAIENEVQSVLDGSAQNLQLDNEAIQKVRLPVQFEKLITSNQSNISDDYTTSTSIPSENF